MDPRTLEVKDEKYHKQILRKNEIISELVDVLAGRVPKSVFIGII